jgi:formylglycine-generating enzyme required for sulfatase activity
MEFVLIPAGKFLMGSSSCDRESRDFEKPQHEVTISKPFYVGRYEVTQAQWEAVMGSNPYTLLRQQPRGRSDRSRSGFETGGARRKLARHGDKLAYGLPARL